MRWSLLFDVDEVDEVSDDGDDVESELADSDEPEKR